jgi:DNA polymerase
MKVVEEAIILDGETREELQEAMRELTDLDNPNSVAQMKQWLSDQGTEVESLGKKDVAKLIDEVPDEQREVLLLRATARSSWRTLCRRYPGIS